MVTGSAAKRKPRRNVRLRSQGERPVRGEAGFGLKLIWFFCKKLMLGVGLVLLTLIFILGYDYATQTGFLALTKIQVAGNSTLNVAELTAVTGLEPGKNLFNLNLAEARLRLLTHEWVQEATVTRILPDGILIEIDEQEALFCADLGQIFIVNTAGFVFKPALAENTRRLPTVRGLNISAEYWVDAEDFCLWTATRGIPPPEVNKIVALQEFLELCQQNHRVMGLALISDIETDGLTGITALMRNGRIVKFGVGSLRKKFDNYSRFMAYADSALSGREVKAVDLRDTARIVVKQESMQQTR